MYLGETPGGTRGEILDVTKISISWMYTKTLKNFQIMEKMRLQGWISKKYIKKH